MYYHPPTRRAKIMETDHKKHVKQLWFSYCGIWKFPIELNCSATLNNIWQFFMKLNMHFSYDLGILHLVVNPREMKAQVHTKTYARMYISSLFTIVPNWKQLKCPSRGDHTYKL